MLTRQAYQDLTEIESPEQAGEYLRYTHNLFIATFASAMVTNALSLAVDANESLEIYWMIAGVINLALLVYLVYYSIKIKRLTKRVSKAKIIFSFLFAPLSWLWFYPELVRPLRIIAGVLPVESPADTERKQELNRKANTKFWTIFAVLAVGVALSLAVMVGAAVYMDQNDTPYVLEPVGQELDINLAANIAGDYEWTDVELLEQNFSAVFPSQPVRENTSGLDPDTDATVYTVSYQSYVDNHGYYLWVDDYNSQDKHLGNLNFSSVKVLEQRLDDILAYYGMAELISKDFTILQGRDALDYALTVDGLVLRGRLTYDQDSLYTLMVEYPSGDAIGDLDYATFLDGFSFIE